LRAAGFDPLDPTAEWRERDRALLRVELHDTSRGSARVRGWSVALGIAEPPGPIGPVQRSWYEIDGERIEQTSRLLPTLVLVRAEDAEEVDVSVSELPELYLRRGLFELCAELERLRALAEPAEPSQATRNELAGLQAHGILALVSFLRLMQENESLADVLWTVVRKPSWIKVLLQGGVRLSVEANFDASMRIATPLQPPLDALPAYAIPLSLALNGREALVCRLVVCPPEPPLRLVAGIVRIEGTHPDHPERRVVVQLQGARLGDLPVE
jgi:hypothetical protein